MVACLFRGRGSGDESDVLVQVIWQLVARARWQCAYVLNGVYLKCDDKFILWSADFFCKNVD